jgi:alpha-N-arabinofuranosidase
VQARLRSKKRHYLCFDEWNVWYRTTTPEYTNGRDKFAPHLIEEEYNLEDALVVAGFLNSFIRHADVVKIANLAQIVNVIAPILTRGDGILQQSIYYPLAIFAQRRTGMALQPVVKGPGYESPSYGYIHSIDTSAILDHEVIHTFLINRSIDEDSIVEIVPVGIRLKSVRSAELITGPNAKACNTFQQPDTISNQPFRQIILNDGCVNVQLPPLSIAAISIELAMETG